jgi:4-hydroxy-2-oxoheptanedioate aldolase
LTCCIGALDSGAHDIVVPLLETADDTRRLVESAKFPPVGRRGLGSPFAMGPTGNVSHTEYIMQANKALLIIVQIETREVLENVSAALVLNYYEDTLG